MSSTALSLSVSKVEGPTTHCQPDAILRVSGLTVRFQGIVALDGVSFEIERGSIAGLIGPNGAGKTTLFNCLSGLYPVAQGEITLNKTRISHLSSHRIARMGIARTFQNLALFEDMNVWDNVKAGRHTRTRSGFVANALRLPSVRIEEAETASRLCQLLELMQLSEVAEAPVSSLTFATRKRVELARALASEPSLLLLDEPAAGLNRAEVLAIEKLLRDVRETLGITIVLVEHHMGLVMSLCTQVIALNTGRKIAEGPAETVQRHPEVLKAYLGTAA